MQVAQHSLVRVVYQVSYFQLILYRVTSAAPLVASSPRLQRITFLHHNELAVITYNIQSIHRPEAYLSNFIHNYLLSTNTPLTIVWQIFIFDRELVATCLGVVVVVVDWWWWCTLSNRMGIGMISSSVVHQVNTHRFTESDFWHDVILFRHRPWRPPTARWCSSICRLPASSPSACDGHWLAVWATVPDP